jgi:DUF1680 family protein
MWNWRLLQITGKAKYADLIERLLYNGILVGQSIDGLRYTYTNPLKSFGNDIRNEWFICACCPPNIARTISSLGKYIYSKFNNGLYIHQYIGNTLDTLIQDVDCQISMKSKLPWQGDIKIELALSKPVEFSLFLRIPEWTTSTRIKIDGKPLKEKKLPGTYCEVRKTWSTQNELILQFDLKSKLKVSNPRIKETQGMVAIQNGPLIYCMEQIDNPQFDIFEAKISSNPQLKVNHKEDLLGGVNIIKGDLTNQKEFVMIPYYAWCNRGANKMQVWHQYKAR